MASRREFLEELRARLRRQIGEAKTKGRGTRDLEILLREATTEALRIDHHRKMRMSRRSADAPAPAPA